MALADMEISTRDTVVVARLSGELDLSNSRSMEAAIAAATPNQAETMVLDVSALEYIDSAGIRLIYQLRERLAVRGQDLRLVIPPQSAAADALRLAGVMDSTRHFGSVEEAAR